MERRDYKKEAEDIRNRVVAIVTSPISIEEKAALLDEEFARILGCLEFDYYFRQWLEGYAKRYAKLAITKEKKK